MSPQIQEQDPQATATPDLSPEELIALISKPISDVISLRIDQEVDYEKTWQLLRIREVDLYIRQLQFLELDSSGGYLDWVPAGSQSNGGDDDGGLYDYNLDVIDSYRKKYIATLGLRPFYNVVFQADDPQSDADKRAARQANLLAGWMRHKWNVRIRNIEMFDAQYSAGTVYIYNPYVADKDAFGEIEQPKYETQWVEQPGGMDPLTSVPAPPTMLPITVEAGTEKYAASGPAFYICSGDTVTTPFSCRDFRKVPYLLYEYEESQGILLQMYGKILREKLKDNGELSGADASSARTQGKLTRQGEASLTGAYRNNDGSLWTHSRYWLATSMYEFVTQDDIRQTLYEKFPDGLKVSQVEGIVVRMENESVNEVWGCVLPYPGKTIYQDPVAWTLLPIQDAINDLLNIRMAKQERGLPSAIGDVDLLDYDEIRNRRYLPKEIVPAKASYGGNLRDAIVNLPTPNKDDGESDVLNGMFTENVQNRMGLLPSVWGGTSRQETASGQRMEITQGLQQLGIPGEYVSQGYAEAYTRGCKLIAKYAPEGFVITVPDDPNGLTSEMLDLDALRAGHYHAEPAPTMPMSWSEKREQLNAIITENPDLANAMGLTSPLGAAAVRDVLLPDMEEIADPVGDVRNKVVERIQELLQQAPIPGPIDPFTGQAGPSLPSIMPEEYVDDPMQHAQMVREWLNSAPGRKASTDPQRMAGYQNIVAYGLLCATKAMPPPPPPGMEPGPDQPQGGPPKPEQRSPEALPPPPPQQPAVQPPQQIQ